MITIQVASEIFTHALYDSLIDRIGRIDGIYLRASRALAGEYSYAFKDVPQLIPFVYDNRMASNKIEIKDAMTGESLAEVVGLAYPVHAKDIQ